MSLEPETIMDQQWFEMRDVRQRTFERAVWIPLRAIQQLEELGSSGHAGHRSHFFGAGSLAVYSHQRETAAQLGWMDVGISRSHKGYCDGDTYSPAYLYEDHCGKAIGEHLVLEQRGNRIEPRQWHLNQDFVVTMDLKREGDVWVRPNEGYLPVARLARSHDGVPVLIEVRSSHLRDYLCARHMALYITSYRNRLEVVENADHIGWTNGESTETNEADNWEGRILEIHEGGRPFGASTAVFHVARTDVDDEDDVPDFGFPTDDTVQSQSWTLTDGGRKLFRVQAELWRNEWIQPAESSPIVRGDETKPSVFFITDAEGKQEGKDTLVSGGRWLWFRPDVMSVLAHRRGGSLTWYTAETGGVACCPDYVVHFGVNRLGLINVYAKDIGLLPDWQQRIWAGHNVSPEGKVSSELLDSQMRAKPADTLAPEPFLARGLTLLNKVVEIAYGICVVRTHELVPDLLAKCHRFRAVDKAGLYALAKDVARVTADSFDSTAIQSVVSPPKGEKWGSLKSLEKLLATKTDPTKARTMLGSLVGVYELRHGDAHLPRSDIDDALSLAGVDRAQPYVHQGYQLLHSCVSSIWEIVETLRPPDGGQHNGL